MSCFKQVNQLFDQSKNSISCDYFDVDDFNKIVINQSDLTAIHLNISSQALHIDKLKLFHSLIKTKFDIICISESRITKNNSLTTNINIPGYNFEHTPTESKAGDSLMYILDKISYKLRNDLNIYCSKQLESVFIEVLIPNKQNQLIGTVYKHPSMNVSKFNHEYLTDILTKIKNENKNIILMGDFNVNLVNYYKNRGTFGFLEQLFNYNFTPQITFPTRITEKAATLIDNIFVNGQAQKYNPGNITTSISDHLPQLIIIENGKGDKPANKTARTTYGDYKTFHMDSFKTDLQGIDWTFATHSNDVNLGFEPFLRVFNNNLRQTCTNKGIHKKRRKNEIKTMSYQRNKRNLCQKETKSTNK